MSSDVHDCCRCAGKMREGRHDFMARVGDEIIVIKDVPALICDTWGEVEYTLEVSREIDVIMKEFFAGRLLAKPGCGGDQIYAQDCRLDCLSVFCFNMLTHERADQTAAMGMPVEGCSSDEAGGYKGIELPVGTGKDRYLYINGNKRLSRNL